MLLFNITQLVRKCDQQLISINCVDLHGVHMLEFKLIGYTKTVLLTLPGLTTRICNSSIEETISTIKSTIQEANNGNQ